VSSWKLNGNLFEEKLVFRNGREVIPVTLVASGGAAQRKVTKVSQSFCSERGS